MRTVISVLTCSLLLLAAACASDQAGDESGARYPVQLSPGSDLEDGQSCGVDGPDCPDATICAVVHLAAGDSAPTCVSEDICTQATCEGDSECTVAESFPVQIFCSGTCTGSDCDAPTHS
jgi:hypothetical protein